MLGCKCSLSGNPLASVASQRNVQQVNTQKLAARGFRVAFSSHADTRYQSRKCPTTLRAAKPDTEPRMTASMDIENLDRDYCDDFVCTSSPAVEQTVKSFARDIQRIKYTSALFQPDAQYQDGFRSFKGSLKYRKLSWIRDILEKPRTEVMRLQMVDKGTAQIDWVLSGTIRSMQVRIPMESRITMNLLTGRIEKHTEKWDLSGCSPPAAALLTVSRMLWSFKAASSDAGEDISNSVASLSSMDQESQDVYMNPSDPTRFFQQGGGNSQFGDILSFATVVAALYFVYKAFEAIETLN